MEDEKKLWDMTLDDNTNKITDFQMRLPDGKIYKSWEAFNGEIKS